MESYLRVQNAGKTADLCGALTFVVFKDLPLFLRVFGVLKMQISNQHIAHEIRGSRHDKCSNFIDN
jgi:hypothetical protein